MLKITHNAGFFSCCNVKFHRILEYFNANKCLPVTIDSSQQFRLYKSVALKNIDITNHFFLSPQKNTLSFQFKEPIVISEDKREDQFSDYTRLNIAKIKPFIENYFSPASEIEYIKNVLLTSYEINPEECIAVYYRGTDKYQETTLGEHSTYAEKLYDLLKTNPNAKVIIQTDSTDFLNYIKTLFQNKIKQNKIIIIDENRTSNKNIGIHHENDGDANYKEMKYLFATFLILSECKHIITSSVNCSLWMMYYRGNTNNVHQYLDKGFI